MDYKIIKKEFNITLSKEKEEEKTEQTNKTEIVKKIAEFFEEQAKKIEDIIKVDNSFINLQESSSFNEKEKENLMILLRKIMFVIREYQEEEIKNNKGWQEKSINNFINVWNDIKPKIIIFFNKLKLIWKEDENKSLKTTNRKRIKKEYEYLG